MNEFWGVDDGTYKFDTTSLQEHFPVLEHKIGSNVPLEIEVTFKNVSVELGNPGHDIAMNATLGFNVSYFEGDELRHVLYDENAVITTMNAYADQDFFYFALIECKMADDWETLSKTSPTLATMDFTQSQYRSFQSSLGYSLNFMRKFLNDVFFRQGIEAPYYTYEIYTQLKFYPGKAVVFLELEDRLDEYFEEKFWDDAAREAAERDNFETPDFSFDDDRQHSSH